MGCGASAEERACNKLIKELEEEERKRLEAVKEAEASWIHDKDFRADILCDRYDLVEKLSEIASDMSKHPSLQKKTIKTIHAGLEDEDSPAHPASLVSVKSLIRAFEREGLAEEVAVELVRLAAGAICKRDQLAQYLKDLQDDRPCEKPLCFDVRDDASAERRRKLLLSTQAATLTQELPSYVTAAAIGQQWVSKHNDYESVDFKELCLLACEHAADSMVIQLDIVSGEDGKSTVICTSLGGEEVLVISVNLQQEVVANIRSALAEKLQISGRRLHMVTSNGEVLRHRNDWKSLSTVQFAQRTDLTTSAK